MAKATKKVVTVKYKLGRSTKGTHVYEQTSEPEVAKTVYINKSAVDGAPETMTAVFTFGE